jgi:hypothetical protein
VKIAKKEKTKKQKKRTVSTPTHHEQ